MMGAPIWWSFNVVRSPITFPSRGQQAALDVGPSPGREGKQKAARWGGRQGVNVEIYLTVSHVSTDCPPQVTVTGQSPGVVLRPTVQNQET